ncbi:MAG: SIMPL domain-containing protein [archaeon]
MNKVKEAKMEQKNIITTILVIGLVITSAILAINMKTGNTIVTTNGEQRNTISVSGQGKVSTQPDKAELYIKITTEGSTATAAKDANSETSEKVINALKGEGVPKKDIETNYYYLNKKQEWDENQRKYVDVGYEVNHILKVTTTELDKVGKLLDTAVNAGANGVDSVNFGLTDEKQKQVSGEALKVAAKEAEGKADSIADSVGVQLGKLVTVSESNFVYTPYVYRDVMYAKAEAGGAPATEILPQTLEITATVSLIYEIK